MDGDPASAPAMQIGKEPRSGDNPYKGFSLVQLQDALVDMEYQLECARDSIDQLSACKAEGVKKDSVITSLRKELTTYKKNAWSGDLSYVSIREQLAASECHLQEKTDEMKILRNELEETRGELKAMVGRFGAAQSKLFGTSTQRDQDIQKLQSQHEADTALLEQAQQELAQKKLDLISLRDRVKKLRNTNQGLQKTLEKSQSQFEDIVKSERKLRAEVAQLKNHYSDGKLLQAKIDFTEEELAKSKEREKVMAVDIKTLRGELNSLCENVSSLVGSGGDVHSPAVTVSAVSILARDYSEVNGKLTIAEQELEQLTEEHSALCECIDHLKQSWTDCKGVVLDDPLKGVNSLVLSLQSLQSQHCLKDLVVVIQDVLTSLHDCFNVASITLTQLVERITTSYNAVDGHDHEENDPLSMVLFMSKTLQSTIQEAKQLRQKLCGTEMECSAALSGALTALRHDEEARLNKKVEKVREEEKRKHDHQLNELKQVWELEKGDALREAEAKMEVITVELENLQHVCVTQAQDYKLLQEKVVGLESKLQDEDLRRKELLRTTQGQKKELKQQLLEETIVCKEQSEQYALTIVALEEKLLKSMDKCNSLHTDNVDLFEELKVKTTTCEDDLKSAAEKVQSMEELTAALRKQVSRAVKEGIEKQSRISELEERLKTVERQRQECEEQIRGQHLAEVTDLRLTLSTQEATLESQKAEIKQLRGLINERSLKGEQNMRTTNELDYSKQKDPHLSKMSHNTRIIEAGQQCIGEKHYDIIVKQRGVIAQLKQQVCDLELVKPPIGSHQATLKQLSIVRDELLKAKAVQTSSRQQEMANADSKKALPSDCVVHQELQDDSKLKDILGQSERSYIHLVNTICQHLPEVKIPDHSKFAAYGEVNDTDELLKQRKQFAAVVSKHIQSIQERTRRFILYVFHITLVTTAIAIANVVGLVRSRVHLK